MKKTELYGYVYDFSVDYDCIDVDNILYILKYLMKKHGIMSRLIKQVFNPLLSVCGSTK